MRTQSVPASLLAQLSRYPWQRDLKKLAAENGPTGLLGAIFLAVGSSTFRSFRKHKQNSPSVVFRRWACEELYSGAFEDLLGINSASTYDQWLMTLARRLDKRWQRDLHSPSDMPRMLKLLNLLAKRLCTVPPFWPLRYRHIVRHLHVPLDRYTLRALADFEDMIPSLKTPRLPLQNASMGSVADLEKYWVLQKAIRLLCKKAGVPPIAYECFAWDRQHK